MGVSQNWGYHYGGPNDKDYSILGSILGNPNVGKPLYRGLRFEFRVSGLGFRGPYYFRVI